MRKEIVTVEKTTVRFYYLGNGHKVRQTTTRLGFQSVEVPSLFMDAETALKRFYRDNGVYASVLGHVIQKRQWPENSFHMFGFCGRFSITMEQDRDTNCHQVRLNYNSPINKQWYWFATGKRTIDTDYFYNTKSIIATLQCMIRGHAFRFSPLAETMQIPLG